MTPPQPARSLEGLIPVRHYDLAATLTSGQAFRWKPHQGAWVGVVQNRWVQVRQLSPTCLQALTPDPAPRASEPARAQADPWQWLRHYLQSNVALDSILETFPQDPPLLESIRACPGLRLLRQDPWECLASFILSSNKQIVQIQQIIDALCQRHGAPIPAPPGHPPARAFPTARILAGLSEPDLRACKMGYRAPHLLHTSRLITQGFLDLDSIHHLPLPEARTQLLRCPGVGPKIVDCVLLFAYGFARAFPVDVWVRKALRELYFPKRQPAPKRLERFIRTHFGPNAGYAQQYLFHYMRTRGKLNSP